MRNAASSVSAGNMKHLLLSLLLASPALASDLYPAPDLTEYYEMLRMPDQPMISCCGMGDAYIADETEVDLATGDIIAVITDTRPDSFTLPDGRTINRVHIPAGTRFVVPKQKIRKKPIPNPTGHTIVFIGAQMNVLCYEPLPLG
jgi:hypothetical protein